MPTITSAQSGDWSLGTTWVGGSPPADGDTVVIAAGHSVKMNVDMSAWTGLVAITINGSNTTPGMLYFMNGSSAYLKMREAGTGIMGTTGTYKGRLLVNSDGIWGNTGAVDFATKIIIVPRNISCGNLDIFIKCAEPTIKAARVYGTRTVVTLSGDTFTGATLTNGTLVAFRSSGTLPGLIKEQVLYQVTNASGNTFKVYPYYSFNIALTPSSPGTGTLEVFTGPANGATSLNVYGADLTTDSHWSNTTGQNYINLVNGFQSSSSWQPNTISALTATSITLGTALAQAFTPLCYVVLTYRNVQIFHDSPTADYLFDSITNAYVAAGCMPRNSSGVYQTTLNYQRSYCFNNATNCTFEGIIAHFQIAISVRGSYVTGSGIMTGILYGLYAGSSTNRVGTAFNGSVYGASIFCYLVYTTLSGYFFALTTLFNSAHHSKTVDITVEGCDYAVGSSNHVILDGDFYNTKIMFSGCFNCKTTIDTKAYASNILFGASSVNCTFSGYLEGVAGVHATPFYNTFDGTVVDIPGAYHINGVTARGIIKNCTITLPIKPSSSGISNESYYWRLKLSNLNGTPYNDGFYDAVSTGRRVAQSTNGAPVAYDTINDCLKVVIDNPSCSKLFPSHVIDDQKVWCNAGARTVRIRVVYSAAVSLAPGDLRLIVDFSASSGLNRVTEESVTITNATDWSQYIEVSFTQGYSDFVLINLFYCKYLANSALFVWPWPEVI